MGAFDLFHQYFGGTIHDVKTWKRKKECPNKNCVGGIITFNGQTGRLCKKCHPNKKK